MLSISTAHEPPLLDAPSATRRVRAYGPPTAAGRQGRALGDRSADPIRQKCTDPHGCPGRRDSREHQGCQANDPVELASTRMLPPVARKQPVLTGRHPSLLARDAPPFAQYLEQVGRENDIPILLALALFDPDEHPVTMDIGELERYDLRGSQAGGVSQAQERLVLDVSRRGEQPTNLFRAQNNGQAARLAGGDDLLGKIAALQRDLEEEPQSSGTDVDGRYRHPDRRQPQLIAMDILGGGLVGRPAQKIGKPFDVADIVELSLGAKPPDRDVLDQSPA